MADRPCFDRFMGKVEASPLCWEWRGRRTSDGYGLFRIGRSDRYAHRFAWSALVGPIPAGLELDHLCRNRGCVNPAHLQPVAHAENVRRSLAARGGAA